MTNDLENAGLPECVVSLVGKLDALDLTADEQRAFGALLGGECDDCDEVVGFGMKPDGRADGGDRVVVSVRGFTIGMPPMRTIENFVDSGGNPKV